ncbi:hypothetical protein FB639_004125, partial [Coemansia asiatica]
MNSDSIMDYPGYPEEELEQNQSSSNQIQVLTNYSRATLKAKQLHVYRVEIVNLDAVNAAIHAGSQDSDQQSPIIPIREVQEQPIRQALFEKAQQSKPELQNLVFDSRSFAYTCKNIHKDWKDLDKQQCVLEIPYMAKDFACNFQLLIKHQRSYDTDILDKYCRGESDLKANSGYIQGMMFALDTVLRIGARVFSDVDGRHVDPTMKINTLCGFDILWAYRFTTKAGRNSLYVNVSAKGVPVTNQPNLLLLSRALLKNKKDLETADSKRLSADSLPVSKWVSKVGLSLIDLAVQVPGSSEEHRVKTLTSQSAQDLESPEDDGCSMVQHYQRKFGLHITSPHLPCAQMTDGALVPLEHCVISRPQYLRELRGFAQDHLMAQTALKPKNRMALFQHAISSLVKAKPAELEKIGMEIHPQLETLPAQVLLPPKILGKDKKPVEIQKHQYWSFSADTQ